MPKVYSRVHFTPGCSADNGLHIHVHKMRNVCGIFESDPHVEYAGNVLLSSAAYLCCSSTSQRTVRMLIIDNACTHFMAMGKTRKSVNSQCSSKEPKLHKVGQARE